MKIQMKQQFLKYTEYVYSKFLPMEIWGENIVRVRGTATNVMYYMQ